MVKSLSFTDLDKSGPSHEILAWQVGILTLFTKIKFSRKFLNLGYC